MQFYSLFYKIYIVGNNSIREKDIENFHRLERSKDLDILLDRIGDSQFVLLGEASHGTSEFYRWRTQISKRLINEKGFSFIAVEGDWPDCYKVNSYIKGFPDSGKNSYDILHSNLGQLVRERKNNNNTVLVGFGT